MRFKTDLVEGTFLKRYKRFFADVRLDDGTVVVAHCANSGSMKTCLIEGSRAWLTRAPEGRKLAYTWEVVEDGATRIYVNPAAANAVVEEAIRGDVVEELRGYDDLRREVKYGEKSRIDVLLSKTDGALCYVEVKNVTLKLGDERGAFPDAVTERGKKHLEELSAMVQAGHRAVLFYCVSRTDVNSVEPADHIDPAYGAALRDAARAGVEILAYRARIEHDGVTLSERLPVRL